MIEKREILAISQQTSLTPHVVEKDYVLGWMLAGIYSHEDLAESWVFKGGTCLKKCFFETYRFSEDLDFTLIKPEHIDADFLKNVFSEIGEWIYEQTGIEIPADKQEFEIYQNPRGQISCQGKISYKGPVSSTHGLPRVQTRPDSGRACRSTTRSRADFSPVHRRSRRRHQRPGLRLHRGVR